MKNQEECGRPDLHEKAEMVKSKFPHVEGNSRMSITPALATTHIFWASPTASERNISSPFFLEIPVSKCVPAYNLFGPNQIIGRNTFDVRAFGRNFSQNPLEKPKRNAPTLAEGNNKNPFQLLAELLGHRKQMLKKLIISASLLPPRSPIHICFRHKNSFLDPYCVIFIYQIR